MHIDLLKHTIVNVCKSVTFGMKKPDKKFFRTYLESVLEYRTTVLSRLGDTKKTDAKYLLKYFSRNLWKDSFADLQDKVFGVLCKLVWKLPLNVCFCLDSVDLNKYSAEKMEGLSMVRDGSTGDIVNGYVLNAVSVQGIPVMLEREELEDGDEGKTTRFDIFSAHIGKIRSTFWSGYWILADRLYDDVKKFNLLTIQKFRFAIRMKTSRYVTVISGPEAFIWKRVRTGALTEGIYEVTFPKLTKPCYLTVLALPGYKNPIRVLSNESDPRIVEQYLKRWEIERIFRSGKQEFELEKIGTQSKRKIDNLIAMVQLCIGISVHIYGKIEQEDGIKNEQTKRKVVASTTTFRKELKKYLKRVSLTFNRNSIIGFIGEYMKKVKKMKYYLKWVTLNPANSSQLRLDFGC